MWDLAARYGGREVISPPLMQVQGPYIGEDDRVKHVKKIGEAIPDQPLKGELVAVCECCHVLVLLQ